MEEREFRQACSRFPSGVTVVTRTRDLDGERLGVTVSSFAPVSLDPPLVLVCIHERSSFLTGLAPGGELVINVLSEQHREIADRFAKLPPAERFIDPYWKGLELRGAASALRCSLREMLPGGDHAILLAEVRSVGVSAAEPLAYCRSAYCRLPPPSGASSPEPCRCASDPDAAPLR